MRMPFFPHNIRYTAHIVSPADRRKCARCTRREQWCPILNLLKRPQPLEGSVRHAAGDAVNRAGSGARSCARSGRGPGRWPERGFGRGDRTLRPAGCASGSRSARGWAGWARRRDHDEFHLRQRRSALRGRRREPGGGQVRRLHRHAQAGARRRLAAGIAGAGADDLPAASGARQRPAPPARDAGLAQRISGSGASGSAAGLPWPATAALPCAASGRAGRRAGACRSSRPARCRPAACTARW